MLLFWFYETLNGGLTVAGSCLVVSECLYIPSAGEDHSTREVQSQAQQQLL